MTSQGENGRFISSFDEVIDRICKALNLGEGIKSFSIDVEAGEAVKVYCTRYVTREEAAKVMNIVEEEFQNGVFEVDSEYYINGKPARGCD
jgi:predicted DNA-binding protein (UPF0251 family)